MDIRSQAVENVDALHGYTYEFSHNPHRHLEAYDIEEERLLVSAPFIERFKTFPQLLTLLVSQGRYRDAEALLDRYVERINWEIEQGR